MSSELIGQLLGITLLVVILCCAAIGSNRGLIYGLYSMIKNILVVIVAIGLAPVIARRLPETMTAREGIGYLIAFVASVFVFNIIGKLIRIFDDIPGVSGLNRLAGAVFGVIIGFFMVWSILAIIGSLQEYTWCKAIVEAARQNGFVMWFQSTSPLPAVLKMLDFPVI